MNCTIKTFAAPGITGTFRARVWSAGYATCQQACSAGLVDLNVFVGMSQLRAGA